MTLARDVLGPGSPLSRMLGRYEERPAQLTMAEAIESALATDHSLLVEAGTGTGKTLAYLVPAILSGRKVVISTATKALQDQVFEKDLPLVAEALRAHGVEFRAALMKGLPNYLCKRRFQELRAAGGGGIAPGMLARLERWARVTETGDRAELEDLSDDAEIWREVQSSSDTRIGAGCDYFDQCFVTRMRREADEAQIVVVNHHLFLADLALRSGPSRAVASEDGVAPPDGYAAAIPNYDAVIFDEAHQIEDVATDFFGVRVSSARVDALVRDAERSLIAAGKLEMTRSGPGRAMLESASESARAFFASLRATAAARGADTRRVLSPSDWNDESLTRFRDLDARLHALWAYAGEQAHSMPREKRGVAEALHGIARRAVDLRRDLDDVVEGSRHASSTEADDDGVVEREPRVAWIDIRARSISIGASPIELGPTLRKRLFDRVRCVVCTSATLATGRSFHFAKARLGAPPDAAELLVPSPFDFASRAALYVPRDLPEPSSPEFDPAATERIAELVAITGGGAFVLCTSNRAMRSLHASLAHRLNAPVMVQGDAPKHVLLSRFRSHGHAVLVATMSFWEGVDVPGRALRLVVIDKVPFAVPTDPVVAARCARIDDNGGNSFTQYSVPSAAITLKQGFGRLIRTQSDAGIVAILDRRLITKGYGKSLLASLPPARRIADLEALRAFWRSVDDGGEAALTA